MTLPLAPQRHLPTRAKPMEPKPKRIDAPRTSQQTDDVLSVSLFGALATSFRGRPIDLKLRKAAAILGYLCQQENLVARRDRLAFLLWSESDNNSARTSLRQTLITLRRAFRAVGYFGLKTSKITVSLDPQGVNVDLRRIVGAADEGRIDDALFAVERLPETLLEGMEDLDEEFRMWLLPTRQALHNRLERFLSARLNDPATPEPLRMQAARALLRIDPTNEAALHHEVLSFAQGGDVVGALRSYRRFEKLLASDYGLRPSAELQMLIYRVQTESRRGDVSTLGRERHDRFNPQSQRGTGAQPGRTQQTIVIRLDPFAVQGIDASQNYLVMGFRHALTASLVRFREWVIVDGRQETGPRGAAMDYDYALQATLYEVDGAIEVVLTLLRLEDSSYLWSQIIRLQLEKWLATQHDIIRGIASTLQVHISAERLSRVIDQTTMPVTAFDQWLRAQAAAFTLERSRVQEARDTLNAVARTNPTYSPLFSALAQLDNIDSMVHPGVFRNPLISQSGIQSARRAVQLDALDSRAHLAFGWAHAFAWDFDAATPHMRLAVELNESDPWPHISAAMFWALAGQMKLASESVDTFCRRSGSLTATETGYLAQIQFLKCEFELALATFQRIETIVPTIPAWKASALAHLGRVAEAKQMGREFLNRTRAAWTGAVEPTDENMVSWLLQAHPFRHFPHWTMMREGLRRSQLPVRHAEHSAYFTAHHRQKVEV